jgi:solute:Na+ symporter, SSS family
LAVFFWRRATTAGAMSSIVLGTVVTIGWQLSQQYGPRELRNALEPIDAVYPALLCSVMSLILVSLFTGQHTIRSDEHREHSGRSAAR